MTDEEAMALGLRAVACKGFRWMGGMMDMQGRTVTPCILFRAHPSDTPDFRDPATMGCLLALVREAWGDPTATTAATREADRSRGWLVDCWDTQSPLSGLGPFKSEAEALVAALEAAPA